MTQDFPNLELLDPICNLKNSGKSAPLVQIPPTVEGIKRISEIIERGCRQNLRAISDSFDTMNSIDSIVRSI
jgi:hypothetical protein